MDTAALKAEIESDPQSLGYAGKFDQEIADLLNLRRTTIQINKGLITGMEFLDSFRDQDFSAMTAAETAKVNMLLTANGGMVDNASDLNINLLKQVLVAYPQTVGRIETKRTRNGSRAEALFGAGTVVTHMDVAQAKLLP